MYELTPGNCIFFAFLYREKCICALLKWMKMLHGAVISNKCVLVTLADVFNGELIVSESLAHYP